MDNGISLAKMYKEHTERYGERVTVPLGPVNFERDGLVLRVSFDTNLTNEHIRNGERKVEIASQMPEADLQKGWDFLRLINDGTYESDNAVIMAHNTLANVLKRLGFKPAGRDKFRSCFIRDIDGTDLYFEGSAADLEKLAKVGWIPKNVFDYSNIGVLSHHIEEPLTLYGIAIMVGTPNSRLSLRMDDLHRNYELNHRYLGHLGYVKEHLQKLDETFQKK